MSINKAYSLNFGFQTKPANIPPHALIRKCVLSPVKVETIIEKKPIIPENKPDLFLLLTAIAINTQNTGKETLATGNGNVLLGRNTDTSAAGSVNQIVIPLAFN